MQNQSLTAELQNSELIKMKTTNCFTCGKELRKSLDDSYYCSNCNNHFVLQDDDDELEDNIFEEGEDDEDVTLTRSEAYANSAIAELLKEIIKKFDHYGISAEYLVVLSSMYKVLVDFKKYRVNGYLQITLKSSEDADNFTFQEITVDTDGLRLSTGGYTHDDQAGGDSYSEMVFPMEDEYDFRSTMGSIDSFVSEFEDNLIGEGNKFEAFDSGDGIEEL